MGRIGQFINEARRRRVFRVAALYIIAAWVAIQAADAAFPGWDIPESAIRYVWYGAFLGFPFALGFGWYYDITPKGIIRTPPAELGQKIDLSLRRSDYLVLSAFILLVGAVTYGLFERILKAPTEKEFSATVQPITEKSIAVLPFENRSPDPDNAYFADGIHDDLLMLLSKLSDLTVVSRTSSAKYRDTTKTIPEISRELGVAHVMEGAVQRVDDQVHITVQLILAVEDQHIWAKSFDHKLTATNVFSIQSEIAAAIADELQVVLSSEEQQRLVAVPTKNFDAYQAYLLGKQRMKKKNTQSLEDAVAYFQRAIKLDPDFAQAHVGLADTYQLQIRFSGLPHDEMIEKAAPLINRALELNDQLGEAFTSLGGIKRGRGDDAGAEAAYRRALELNPNYIDTYWWYTSLLRSLGRSGEALTLAENGIQIDPLSTSQLGILAYCLDDLGRSEEALVQLRKAIEIDAAYASAYRVIGVINMLSLGRIDEAVIWYRRSLRHDPESPRLPAYLALSYLILGDDHKAEMWTNKALSLGPEGNWPNTAKIYLHLYRSEYETAVTYARKLLRSRSFDMDVIRPLRDQDLRMNQPEKALGLYESNYSWLLNEPKPVINGAVDVLIAIDIASVLLEIGDHDRAQLLLDEGLKSIGGIRRTGSRGYGIADVHIYALKGNTASALASLRAAINQGWSDWRWRYYLEQDPNLDSIRNDPEFQAMVEEIKADMAAQLARVREMEARGELEPIPDIN